jgi:Flp pilus assembly protein TadG
MVELSLVLPLLMLVIVGMSDVPRGIFQYNVISNSAREGAREAILAYNQCQNTGPCSTPPTGSSVIGVQNAITRAGGGSLTYHFADTTSSTSTAPSCTPQANQGCVWVFIVGGNTTTGCTPPNPVSGGGTDSWSLCDFNANKEGGYDVVVEVEYQFAPLTPFLSRVIGSYTLLWAKSQMHTEY